MTATMLKKLLPHSRNVFVVILFSFIFRMVPVLLAVTIVWSMESVLGSGVHHDPWDGIRRVLKLFVFGAGLSDPIAHTIASIVAYLHSVLTTDSQYVHTPMELAFIAPILLCWLACCLVNRRVIFNLPQKSFWFFVIIQSYIAILLFFGITINSLLEGKFLATFTAPINIVGLFFTVFFPLLCWWGVERLRKKYGSKTNA